MKKLKRLLKVMVWRLRGSPRCCRCGKRLYNAVYVHDGELYGAECKRNTVALKNILEESNGKDTDGPTA